jgi:hypothetical protein
VDSTGGGGTVTAPAISTSATNNDDVQSASANTVTIGGASAAGKTFTSLAPIDIVFSVQNTGGATEYFFSEAIVNNSGEIWTDFHLALGFGTGTEFQQSGLEDLLDFDTVAAIVDPRLPTPTASAFSTLDHQANSLDWSGGTVGLGGTLLLTFSIDVPDSTDCSGTIPACPTGDGSYLFTLRQFPTITEPPPPPVPAPAGLFLLGAGGLAWGLWRRLGRSRPAR